MLYNTHPDILREIVCADSTYVAIVRKIGGAIAIAMPLLLCAFTDAHGHVLILVVPVNISSATYLKFCMCTFLLRIGFQCNKTMRIGIHLHGKIAAFVP